MSTNKEFAVRLKRIESKMGSEVKFNTRRPKEKNVVATPSRTKRGAQSTFIASVFALTLPAAIAVAVVVDMTGQTPWEIASRR